MQSLILLLYILFLFTIFSSVQCFTLSKSKQKPSPKEDTKQSNNKNSANNKNDIKQTNSKPKPQPSSHNSKDAPKGKKDSYLSELMKERDTLLKLQQQVTNNNTHSGSASHPAMNALRTVLQRMHPAVNSPNNKTGSSSDSAHVLDKIPKTSFSNKLRILFVAGLEGTGHHAMKSVLKECYTKGLCLTAGDATYDLFKHDGEGDHGLFGVLEGKYSAVLLERYYRHLSELKAKGESLIQKSDDSGHLFVYGLEYQPGAGMLSYPNFNDKEHKVFNHADIIPMAILAESLGFDFRVLVLQRRSYEIFASTMVKRGFGHGLEPKILLLNAAALYSQLSFLDTRFFRCVHYNELLSYSDDTLSRLATFLHPKIDLEMMKRMWQELRPPVNASVSPSVSSVKVTAPVKTTSTSTSVATTSSPITQSTSSTSTSTSTTTSNTPVNTPVNNISNTTSNTSSSSPRLRRALTAAEDTHTTSTSTSSVHHHSHDATPETAEMHEMLRAHEFHILRLAMELKRFDHICPAF